MIIVISFSMLHGILGGEKTIQMIDQMLTAGELSGKFWRITRLESDRITVTKYQKEITIAYPLQQTLQVGDHVSFIARANKISAGDHQTLWKPVKIRVHGKSRFKFMLSFISVFVVLMMCLRFIGFDRKVVSLTFRSENDLCRMV